MTEPIDLDALERQLGLSPLERRLIAKVRALDAELRECHFEIIRYGTDEAVALGRLRAALRVVEASRKRREEQARWFGPDFFMPDKPLVEQAFLNACREEDAALADYEASRGGASKDA